MQRDKGSSGILFFNHKRSVPRNHRQTSTLFMFGYFFLVSVLQYLVVKYEEEKNCLSQILLLFKNFRLFPRKKENLPNMNVSSPLIK